MSIVTRLAKGAPLTFAEMDGNFTTIAGLINAGFNYAIDTGPLNTLQITLATPPALYIDGMNFSTKVANTTTGTATLNINGLGAKNIYDEYNTLLPAKVLQAGQIYTFVYNSSLNSGAGGFNTYVANAVTEPYAATTNNPGTTVGAQLTNLGSATGSTNVGYTPLGTGAVATTTAAKLQQIVSVIDRGAVPDGVTDSTTAIQNATGSNILTWFPKTAAGSTYKITSLSFTGLANFEWKGFGVGGITITTATPGTMLTFGNTCNFGTIDGFVFTPTGVLANSIGLLFNGSSGNLEVRRCIIQLWSKIGFQQLGTVGTQLSGHKLYDSYLLQNANASGFGQLDLTYSNDFFIQNNQFGIINTGTYGFPSFGIQAANTSNGTYVSNFVWQNNVGGNFVSCKYDRLVAGNRFEQSQKEGAIFNNCINVIFEGNWLNNNGILATNTYNHMRWQGCNRCTIANNQGFDWSGGTNTQKYGCSLESNCLNMIIKGNSFAPSPNGYATAAWLFDATMPATTNATDGALRFSSGNTVAAATTTFLGKGAVGAAAFICQEYLDQSHTVVQLVVQVTGAPGAAQSFVYTVYKNGAATGLALTISGAATFQAVVNATTIIEDVSNSSSYTVQLVTSAGAAAAAHYAQIVYCNK